VAQYTVEKILQMGGKAITLSDSSGMICDPEGMDEKKLAFVMELKNVRRGRIKEYADRFKGVIHKAADPGADSNPLWDVKADCAFPCATQNEISAKDAANLVRNGVRLVAEGANMPTTPDGVRIFLEHRILYAPGKAANAGGVATSGLEMSQNSMKLAWTREEVDRRLALIMKAIHRQCVICGQEGGYCNYVKGANVAGFKKVADAMMDEGVV
jgi:glutamate dehydrogenase (NADP+)